MTTGWGRSGLGGQAAGAGNWPVRPTEAPTWNVTNRAGGSPRPRFPAQQKAEAVAVCEASGTEDAPDEQAEHSDPGSVARGSRLKSGPSGPADQSSRDGIGGLRRI